MLKIWGPSSYADTNTYGQRTFVIVRIGGPIGDPSADRSGDGLHRSIQARLQVEDAERGILILCLRDRIPAVRRGREGVASRDAGHTRYGDQQFRLIGIGHVVHVVATVPRA